MTPEPKRPLKVFLCHAHADRDPVRGLYSRLTQDGMDAWLDKEKLLPGQDWELEIRKAVREADVVIVCLSKQFIHAGFKHKEVKWALDTAMEQPEGEIFIIPARLEECDNLESLRKWHWVDLFDANGYERLLDALKIRMGDGLPQKKEEYKLKILVTGGRETSQTVENLAFLIGFQVINRGHIMFNHGTRGVDKAAADGALKACVEKGWFAKELIWVFRPEVESIPDVAFGRLHIIGKTFQERREYVIANSDAVIILGGGKGTREIANQVEVAGKPLIPIGVGDSKEAAVDIWQTMLKSSKYEETQIGYRDLRKIGNINDHEKLAVNAVILSEVLSRSHRN